MATNQVGNLVDINTLLQALNAQNHLQMLSQQARDNTGLQEEFQSEDQASAENKENDFIEKHEIEKGIKQNQGHLDQKFQLASFTMN